MFEYRKQRSSMIDCERLPDAFEGWAIPWAVMAAARTHDAETPVLEADRYDFGARARAALIAIQYLADPNIKGSDELLLAIIEERRRRMD